MDANGKKRAASRTSWDMTVARSDLPTASRSYIARTIRKTDEQKADYKSLLKQNLIRPTVLEIFVMNADGSNKRQVTNNGKANFGPYFSPRREKNIFRRTSTMRAGVISISTRSTSTAPARTNHIQRDV